MSSPQAPHALAGAHGLGAEAPCLAWPVDDVDRRAEDGDVDLAGLEILRPSAIGARKKVGMPW